MANSQAIITEMRFVIEPELLQVYVAYEARGDSPLGVQGWHHKTFPASVSAMEVLKRWSNGHEDPLLWPQKAPGE